MNKSWILNKSHKQFEILKVKNPYNSKQNKTKQLDGELPAM